MKPALVASLCLLACGTEDRDDRPHTLEYITAAILQPSCGTAQCHSEFTQAARREKPEIGRKAIPLIFDTVEHSRATFQRDGSLIDNVGAEVTSVGQCATRTCPTLIINLTREYEDEPRMPFDAPIANDDLELIMDWIQLGGPGVCLGESACQGSVERYCTADRAFDFTRRPKGPCGI